MQDITNETFIIHEQSGSTDFSISHVLNPHDITSDDYMLHFHHWAKRRIGDGLRYTFISGSDIPSDGLFDLKFDFTNYHGYGSSSYYTESFDEFKQNYL